MVVTFPDATLVTRRALPLTWAGLSPAGSRQLRLAHRYTHLKYHLAVRGVLSLDQIASYDRLRGYDTARAPAPGMHGRHSH